MVDTDEHVTPGVRAAAISRRIVRIFHEYTGRGPTKARTTISEDLVVVLMSDTLLKAEKRLASDGHADQVLSMRRAFQDTMRDELTAVVEDVTGRRVVAFMSHNHIEPDLAAELFILAPRTAASPLADSVEEPSPNGA
jgi:uncharacterized protein YbcI